ncbi:hypothetical protein E2562_008403 [Oryza meyeriana var. granulata]|uniref:DUF4378 domain-containing protein n=1 Tax=Oryza meyeriana var. granulata TaxID=110450 RepID=A0A6G1EHK6_9ORYZ|nr:hypothetical protein E2562_008403 [Oryza meyeriana var. granulata]
MDRRRRDFDTKDDDDDQVWRHCGDETESGEGDDDEAATATKEAARTATTSPESKDVQDPVVSSMEETSFTFEFKRGSKRAKKTMPPAEAHRGQDDPSGKSDSRQGFSNKRNLVPAKTPSAKERVPEQVEFTHCAPGIVARLMGLDTVPRPKKALDRCQSDIQCSMQRHLSGGDQVCDASSEDQPCSSSADDLPELKDVFEVTEIENKKMCIGLQSGNKESCPGSDTADLEFVRQKFLDAKRLSTDEAHRNSKEFAEALETLYSKKDVFLEILQENSGVLPGFSGHIFGHSGLQYCKLFDQDNRSSMGVERDGLFNVPKESENPIPSIHLNETYVVPLDPLAPKGSKSKGSSRRSQIVVLKPNLQRKSFTPVLSSKETSHFGQMSTHSCSRPQYHCMYKQQVTHSVPLNNDQVLEAKGDTPGQKGAKQTPKIGSRRKPSGKASQLAIGNERAKGTPSSFEDNLSVFPSNHSVGSSVSRKAKKHLSERWQMACQSDSEISMPKDTITLGEMLEMTDRDATKVTTHKISSETNYNYDNVQKAQTCPVGISSKDGWKRGIYCKDDSRAGTSRNFSRSKSLPTSATNSAKLPGRKQSAPTCNLPILKDLLNAPTDESGSEHVRNRSPFRKTKQRNGRAIVHAGKENVLPVKEIHVTSEKARHSICISDLSRASNTHNGHIDGVMSNGDHQTSGFTALADDLQSSEEKMRWTEQKLTPPLLEAKEDKLIHNLDNIVLKDQEGRSQSVEIDVAEVESQAIDSSRIVNLENHKCSNSTASLQQICGHETAYSGIFKGVSDGIQELRLQLKMLKMDDHDDTCGDDIYMLSGDECSDTDILTYQVMEEQLPVFKDEDDRDFTYTNDILDAVSDFLLYPEDWQVSSNVFLWLEDKYSKLLLWSKSDRRLLFDLINSILADMTAVGNSLHSNIMMKCWSEMDPRKLAENVWQTVLKRRSHEPFSLDCVEALPLDYHSEVEAIGAEIVKMLHDDILEESVAELISH